MSIMEDLKDIVLKCIPGKGYALLPCTRQGAVACNTEVGESCLLDIEDINFVLDIFRELGVTFRYAR